jgi:hypothetical protein
MKKRITRKLMATVAVAMLFVCGTMAQTHNGTELPGVFANYADSTTEAATYMVAGQTVPLWAMPDVYYHPNYNPAASVETLTDGFTWTWAVTSGAPADIAFSQNGAQDNYVAITGGVAGNAYIISVAENAPAAFGGCVDITPSRITVNVVDTPSFYLTGTLDDSLKLCAGSGLLPGAVNTTIAGGWRNYRLTWTLEIATLNAAKTKNWYYDNQAGLNPTVGQKYAVNHTIDETTNPFEALAAATVAHNIMTVPNFPVITVAGTPAVTVYTYKLNSINDQASRYGNFIILDGNSADGSLFTYFPARPAADQFVVVVYPLPKTGPIYHINGAWAN